MFAIGPKVIHTFEWKDLHKKILQIAVAEANPECLEFNTQVYGHDLENGVIYVLAEIPYVAQPDSSLTNKENK